MELTLAQYPYLKPADEAYPKSFPVILDLVRLYENHSINNHKLQAAALEISRENLHFQNTLTEDGCYWYGASIFMNGSVAQAAILFPYHHEKAKLAVLANCSDSDLATLLRNEINAISDIETLSLTPELHRIPVEVWNAGIELLFPG